MTEDATYPNIQAVVAYLQAAGWKLKKSTAYIHLKQGMIRPGEDGTFHERDVLKYAKHFLKRIDPTTTPTVVLEKLQARRLQAEIQKNEAQAAHWKLRSEIETGRYVARDTFYLALAQRAAVFKNDIEAFCRMAAPEIIRAVNGDINKVTDLINYLLEKTGEWLNCYAKDQEFSVPDGVFESLPGAQDTGDDWPETADEGMETDKSGENEAELG